MAVVNSLWLSLGGDLATQLHVSGRHGPTLELGGLWMVKRGSKQWFGLVQKLYRNRTSVQQLPESNFAS